MAIALDDVRHIATLARLGLTESRAALIAVELNGILAHMDLLSTVNTDGVAEAVGPGAPLAALRDDHGPAMRLERPLDAFAPGVRDGLLLVPRVLSHESAE